MHKPTWWDAIHHASYPVLCRYSIKYKHSRRSKDILVSHLLQVLAELGGGVVGVGGLDAVWVVGDDKGLGGLDDDDALFTLILLSGTGRLLRKHSMCYLLRLERVLGCLNGHVLLAAYLYTVGDDRLDL